MEKHKCRIGFWSEHIDYGGSDFNFLTNLKEYAKYYYGKTKMPEDSYELFNYCPDCGKKLK